ncbi:MAG TPA: alpha/beta hydrolase, partial [Methylomirabilota bacterium]|nr:alpha/beta hydrolase [Methylomirabilota bacterium]
MTDSDGDGVSDLIEFLSDPKTASLPGAVAESPANSVPVRVTMSRCYRCHTARLQLGDLTLQTRPPDQPDLSEMVRLAKGRSYPVRVYADYNTSTNNRYTALIQAETTPAGFVLEDPQGILGVNKRVTNNLGALQAWVHVPRLELAVDADRDQVIRFLPSLTDQTTNTAPYTFWVNDDRDSGSTDTAEDLDPAGGAADHADNVILNQRDLEDFSRLHFKLDAINATLLTPANRYTVAFEWRNVTGTPGLRLFRAVETGGATNYLFNATTAGQQIVSPYNTGLGVVTPGAPLSLTNTYWNGASGSNHTRYLLFEGTGEGEGDLVMLLRTNTLVVAESAPVRLRLRKVTDLFEHYTAGDTTLVSPEAIPLDYARAFDSGSYLETATETDDYILFVHGWRMQAWERRSFGATAFKRLYWQGYKGGFGLFSWPTEWTDIINDPFTCGGIPTQTQNYTRSERKAWLSAFALRRLLKDLNARYANRVRVFAHSMGNICTSEALRQHGSRAGNPLVYAYVASQAASVAHAYDATNPETIQVISETPEVYAHFPPTDTVYFKDLSKAVSRDLQGTPRVVNYHNRLDCALGGWETGQDTKPDIGWTFRWGLNRWYRGNTAILGTRLHFPVDTYEIYSHIAEA